MQQTPLLPPPTKNNKKGGREMRTKKKWKNTYWQLCAATTRGPRWWSFLDFLHNTFLFANIPCFLYISHWNVSVQLLDDNSSSRGLILFLRLQFSDEYLSGLCLILYLRDPEAKTGQSNCEKSCLLFWALKNWFSIASTSNKKPSDSQESVRVPVWHSSTFQAKSCVR